MTVLSVRRSGDGFEIEIPAYGLLSPVMPLQLACRIAGGLARRRNITIKLHGLNELETALADGWLCHAARRKTISRLLSGHVVASRVTGDGLVGLPPFKFEVEHPDCVNPSTRGLTYAQILDYLAHEKHRRPFDPWIVGVDPDPDDERPTM